MIYTFLADGFEEIEALCPVDIMRRAGLSVTTVGIGKKEIIGSHGICVCADVTDSDVKFENIDLIFLPGGMPGTKNLDASETVHKAIDLANEGTDTVSPLEVLTRAIENAKPRVEVKSRRVGGATYQVPLEVAPDRSEALAMRWLINYARNRKGIPMAKALANEIKEAAANQGAAVRKRDDVHKMAQANRAFAHFRW